MRDRKPERERAKGWGGTVFRLTSQVLRDAATLRPRLAATTAQHEPGRVNDGHTAHTECIASMGATFYTAGAYRFCDAGLCGRGDEVLHDKREPESLRLVVRE